MLIISTPISWVNHHELQEVLIINGTIMIVKEKIICRACTVPPLLLVYPMSLSVEFQFNFVFPSRKGVQEQGGTFHLKVGRVKSSGNAGDPMLGVAVIP